MQVQLYYRVSILFNWLSTYDGNPKLRNPCSEVVLIDHLTMSKSFIATCQHFILIDITLSILMYHAWCVILIEFILSLACNLQEMKSLIKEICLI